jgi:hypothetical protein
VPASSAGAADGSGLRSRPHAASPTTTIATKRLPMFEQRRIDGDASTSQSRYNRAMRRRTALLLSTFVMWGGGACGSSSDAAATDDAAPADDTSSIAVDVAADAKPADTAASDTTIADAPDASSSDADAALPPIAVDPKDPKRYDFTFKANEADPAAKESLGTQGAYVDTRVPARGVLVVYLHGAGSSAPASCTNGEMANLVTAMGYHLFTPCYNSYYGVDRCKDDIGGCRLEAFDRVDHTAVLTIAPADAIEPRIVAALKLLRTKHPGGDWGYFLDGDRPRWSNIIIAGISHGASTSGLIGLVRTVNRVVMFSGPLDTKQKWLEMPSLTPRDRFYGFTHTGDPQHAGHLEAFATLALPGAPTSIDGASPPYGSSHRLQTSATTTDPHSSTQPGGVSPKSGGAYVFAPAWKYLFGG